MFRSIVAVGTLLALGAGLGILALWAAYSFGG